MSDESAISVNFDGGDLGRHVSTHRMRLLPTVVITLAAAWLLTLHAWAVFSSFVAESNVWQKLLGLVCTFASGLAVVAAVLTRRMKIELFEGGFVRVGLFRSRSATWADILAIDRTNGVATGWGRVFCVQVRRRGWWTIGDGVRGFDRLIGAIEVGVIRSRPAADP